MLQEWVREGFRTARDRERAWESLTATVTLARLMGYNTIYDPEHKNVPGGNALGKVALTLWPGKTGRNGSYQYAFSGTSILAIPRVDSSQGLNMTPSSENVVETLRKAAEIQRSIGPNFEFILG